MVVPRMTSPPSGVGASSSSRVCPRTGFNGAHLDQPGRLPAPRMASTWVWGVPRTPGAELVEVTPSTLSREPVTTLAIMLVEKGRFMRAMRQDLDHHLQLAASRGWPRPSPGRRHSRYSAAAVHAGVSPAQEGVSLAATAGIGRHLVELSEGVVACAPSASVRLSARSGSNCTPYMVTPLTGSRLEARATML